VSGYYALDVTQPDRLQGDGDPLDERVVPSCLSTDNQTVSGCGTLPFPSVLWEFTDSITSSRLDEDGNGFPDLGQTWSVPTIGRIRVVESGKVVDKFVAIFGGGMDADSKLSPKRGNWLYMVDVETGRAIYKRPLVGAAPGDPAVLDVDLDGYLDTVYIGTISGFLYKVNISSPAPMQTVTIPANRALPPLASGQTVPRITDTSWSPFPVFDTVGKPIYFAPTAFYVSALDRFALAFGTGDREDLWGSNNQEGRFYVIIDEGYTLGQTSTGVLPRDETDYEAVDVDSPDDEDADFILKPEAGKQRGWYLRLEPDERVITQSFGLSGIVIFSSFQPQIVISGGSGNGNGNGSSGGGRNGSDAVCARGGDSRIFVVLATSANPLISSGRFRLVPEFVTNPYVEQGATKNPPSGGGVRDTEDLDNIQQEIMKELKKLAPQDCKFANYWFSVSGIRSDTGYERYATIPICVMRRNWKEH
jgi:Tfp pilus tip-associated adhesin PilY1